MTFDNLRQFAAEASLKVDTAVLAEALNFESVQDYAATIDKQNSLQNSLGMFSKNTVSAVEGYLKSVVKAPFKNDLVEASQEAAINKNITHKTLESLARECATSSRKRQSLPAEIQKLISPLTKVQGSLESQSASINPGDVVARKRADYLKNQVNNVIEKVLFGIFSTVDKARQDAGFESMYTYQSTIVYHKLEAMVQYISTCAAIYAKVAKQKTLYDETTSFPIHTWKTVADIIDENGNTLGEIAREDLYNYADPGKAVEKIKVADPSTSKELLAELLYNKLERVLTLEKANCEGQEFRLRHDKLREVADPTNPSGPKIKVPFLAATEVVRSDFYVVVELDDGTKVRVNDRKAGLVQSETFSEADYKGKWLEVKTDAKDPEKVIKLAIDFDGNLMTTSVMYKDDKSTKKLAKVHFEFKLYDIYNMEHGHVRFRQYSERTFLNAGSNGLLVLPLIKSEMAKIDARTGGDFYSRTMALQAEYINDWKDKQFFSGIKTLKEELIQEVTQGVDHLLYARQDVDLQVRDSLLKREDMQFNLGPAIQALQSDFGIAANTMNPVQMNMWGSNVSLNVIRPHLVFMTGVVDENSNGTFLGVAQGSRAAVLTTGTNETPIASVVVGTDRRDQFPVYHKVAGDPSQGKLDPEDVVYPFDIIAYYQEPHNETVLYVDTATRVLSDPGFRDPTYPNVPTMRTTWTGKVQAVRKAFGDLTVKGYHMIPTTTVR